MNKHKGQSTVEFALVLPLFLFIMFGIIYTGMMYHDYTTLSNIARSVAREAAVTAGNDDQTYSDIADSDYYKDQLNTLMTSFYKPVGKIVINPVKKGTNDEGVEATINMKLNASGFFVDMILPKAFGVRYYMKKEPFTTSSPSSS